MKLGWVAIITAGLCFCGCTTTKYVPMEFVRTEYKDRNVYSHTTDTVTSTRFVFVKGDTVIDFREKERVRSVEIHDTCYVMRTDSIAVPYPVERKLTRWEQTKMDYGGMAIFTLCALGIIFLISIFCYVKRKLQIT